MSIGKAGLGQAQSLHCQNYVMESKNDRLFMCLELVLRLIALLEARSQGRNNPVGGINPQPCRNVHAVATRPDHFP
jgi:hypothetical protein